VVKENSIFKTFNTTDDNGSITDEFEFSEIIILQVNSIFSPYLGKDRFLYYKSFTIVNYDGTLQFVAYITIINYDPRIVIYDQLAHYDRNCIVQATVITIVNYDRKIFIVQALGIYPLKRFCINLLTLFVSKLFSQQCNKFWLCL
jgi:hypothetical protein